MTIDEMLERLQELRARVGGEAFVNVLVRQPDGSRLGCPTVSLEDEDDDVLLHVNQDWLTE